MFSIQEFMKKLDEIYQSGQTNQIERYLQDGIRQAENQQDKEAILALCNELIGYYRTVSRHEEGLRCSERALELVHELGLTGTVNHGTTLLNVATAHRAAARYPKAEQCYKQAQRIFERQLDAGDYRLTSLYNNMGLLYAETNRPQDAKAFLEAALRLVRRFHPGSAELAITLTNLGNVLFRLQQSAQASDYMKEAVAVFESIGGKPDVHYPSALSGLGEAYFHQGDLEQAEQCYAKALQLIEQIYGKNDDWNTTKRNLQTVQDLQKRKKEFAKNARTGMELAKAYYEEVGKPMLLRKYSQYIGRIAVGLAGEGSECLGFDDGYSVDHDFGPGFCLWLTKEDYHAIGQQLQQDYDALAKEWNGLPARNTTAEGVGRVGVMEIDDYYRRFIGYAQAPEAKTMQDVLTWSKIPPEMLCTAASGQVFEDPLGEFSKRRKELEQYPEPVRLYRLAMALGKMAQAGQYNYLRGRKRGDIGMMYHSLSEFVQAATEVGYLLNRSYMPFYKWRSRGMEQFRCAQKLKPMLEQLMEQTADQTGNEDKIEVICAYVVQELKAQGLSSSTEAFLEQQKLQVLYRMKDLLFAAEANSQQGKQDQSDDTKKQLVNKIVLQEWEQFQKVQNEGGRAACQDDWQTFEIMRKSQFYTWDMPTLESYWQDLQRAESENWNLVMEKYARMMEHTAPELYKDMKEQLPYLSALRVQLQDLLVCIMMRWTRQMEQQYPYLVKMGRKVSAAEDADWETSSETYLRGELCTYSDQTIQLYAQMVLNYLENKSNPVEKNLYEMVRFYGYDSLQAADKNCAERFSKR